LDQVKNYVSTQYWARNNTSEDSVFFIEGAFPVGVSWRTLSNRPVAYPNNVMSFYNYPSYIDEFNLKRIEYWDNAIRFGEVDFLGDWREGFICSSQELYSIDYVVRSRLQKHLNFPVIYENQDFKILKVICPD
jgi:hypothetical protein